MWNKEKDRATITFDCSPELKEKARKAAREFEPVSISLSSLCRLTLQEYIKKLEENKK